MVTLVLALLLCTVLSGTPAAPGMDDPGYIDAISDPDPISQGCKITALIGLYRRRIEDLAVLRARIVEHLAEDKRMTHAEIASALGLSAGRITQIRQGRAFLRRLEGEDDAGQ